jgi:hypothetical protein
MRSPGSKEDYSDQAGFDYYLQALESKSQETKISVQLDLLRTIDQEGGNASLETLLSRYFGDEASGDDLLELTDRLKILQSAGLVSIIGAVKGEKVGGRDVQIAITDEGRLAISPLG